MRAIYGQKALTCIFEPVTAYLGTTSLLLIVVTWRLQRIFCLLFHTFWSPFKAVRSKEMETGRVPYMAGHQRHPGMIALSENTNKETARDEIRPSANEFSIVANFWEKEWSVCSYLMRRRIWWWSYKEKLMIGPLFLDTSQDLFVELGILSQTGATSKVHLWLTDFWL